jgi:hypothetical protein
MISRTDLENRIKAQSDSTWFFASQTKAYNELKNYFSGLHRIVNLHGLQGSGKTFIAHILFKENLVDYVNSPENIRGSDLPLMIDNSYFDRTFARNMRNQMRRYNVRQVVLITRYRVEDVIPAINLEINYNDIDCFRGNLYRYFDLKLPDSRALNLWAHLKLIGDIDEHLSGS